MESFGFPPSETLACSLIHKKAGKGEKLRSLLFHPLPGQANRSGRFWSEFAVNHVCRDEDQSVAGEFIIPDIILSHVIRENTTFHVMDYNRSSPI
jgi:hypothetical protein